MKPGCDRDIGDIRHPELVRAVDDSIAGEVWEEYRGRCRSWHKPPTALGLQVVLAHQAADLPGIDDHPSVTELSTNPAIAIGLKLIADRRDIGDDSASSVFTGGASATTSRQPDPNLGQEA
jgi:hypothetical protein